MYVSFLPIVAKPQAVVYADINIFIGKVPYIDIGQACIYSKNEDIPHDSGLSSTTSNMGLSLDET